MARLRMCCPCAWSLWRLCVGPAAAIGIVGRCLIAVLSAVAALSVPTTVHAAHAAQLTDDDQARYSLHMNVDAARLSAHASQMDVQTREIRIRGQPKDRPAEMSWPGQNQRKAVCGAALNLSQ